MYITTPFRRGRRYLRTVKKSIKVDFYVWLRTTGIVATVIKIQMMFMINKSNKNIETNLYFVSSNGISNNLIKKTCIHFLDLSVHVSTFWCSGNAYVKKKVRFVLINWHNSWTLTFKQQTWLINLIICKKNMCKKNHLRRNC